MKRIIYYIAILACCVGCFEIPDEGTISDQVGFATEEVDLLLKTQQIMGKEYGLNMTIGETTFPFRFSVEKIVRLNEDGSRGEDVTAFFTKKIKIKQWKERFTKDEKTREEFEAKREEVEMPVLSFTESNELIFNYGNDSIKTGVYAMDMRVTNSSGSKLFENVLKLNVKEPVPYKLSSITHSGGVDNTRKCSVIFEKRGDDREYLTVRVQEKTGDFVPLDSITFNPINHSFSSVFHFTEEHTAGGTNIDLPFPVPYNPSNLYSPLNIYRGVQLAGDRWGYYIKEEVKKDEFGNTVYDPITGKPVMVQKVERKKRYGFNFRFMINEPGDWLMTIKFE